MIQDNHRAIEERSSGQIETREPRDDSDRDRRHEHDENGRAGSGEHRDFSQQDELLGRTVRGLCGLPRAVHALVEMVQDVQHRVDGQTRKIERLEVLFEQQGRAIRHLDEKLGLLESVSEQNAVLTRRHYREHVVLPVVKQLAEILDLLGVFVQDGDEEQRRSLEHGITELLDRYGVEVFEAEPYTPFDAKRMNPVSICGCEAAGLNGLVKRTVRRGLSAGDEVIRPVWVEVFRHADES